MKKIEHIGIAVQSLVSANTLYEKLLGVPSYKEEFVEQEQVRTSFFRAGPNKIELLEGTSDNSPITRFIERRGPGIHHIAFEVEDIHKEMQRLREEGFHILSEHPKKGADNKLVCFVHPKTTSGVLIELCQTIPDVE